MMIGRAATAAVAAAEPVDAGKFEHEAACAGCHGAMGKGNGLYVGQLTARVPDLTGFASNNRGIWPSTTLLRSWIAGRK